MINVMVFVEGCEMPIQILSNANIRVDNAADATRIAVLISQTLEFIEHTQDIKAIEPNPLETTQDDIDTESYRPYFFRYN